VCDTIESKILHKDDLHTVLVTYKAELFDKYHNGVMSNRS